MALPFWNEPDQGAYRRSLSNAARRFAFRIGSLHLPDAWRVVNSGDFRKAQARLSRRIPQVEHLVDAFKDTVNRHPFQEVVPAVRNATAHPSEEVIRRALAVVPENWLMDIPISTPGLGDHFNVTDRLLDAFVLDVTHARYRAEDEAQSFDRLVEEMFDAVVALRNLAAALVAAMCLDTVYA